jgi:hypothetical protein
MMLVEKANALKQAPSERNVDFDVDITKAIDCQHFAPMELVFIGVYPFYQHLIPLGFC